METDLCGNRAFTVRLTIKCMCGNRSHWLGWTNCDYFSYHISIFFLHSLSHNPVLSVAAYDKMLYRPLDLFKKKKKRTRNPTIDGMWTDFYELTIIFFSSSLQLLVPVKGNMKYLTRVWS